MTQRTTSIACRYLLQFLFGWKVICSMSNVHVRCHLSGRTFSMSSHAAVSFWPHVVRSLLHIQPCHRSRSSRLFQICLELHRRKRCESYHQHWRSVTGSDFLFTTVTENVLSLSERFVAVSPLFTAEDPALPSVTIRMPAISSYPHD